MYRLYVLITYNGGASSKYKQRAPGGERMFTSIIQTFKPGTTGEKAPIRWRHILEG
jgi:hypothetical protein